MGGGRDLDNVNGHGQAQQDAFELARVVHSKNPPFSVVDDLHMVKFLQHISPGMKIPSRKIIAGCLLNEEYSR